MGGKEVMPQCTFCHHPHTVPITQTVKRYNLPMNPILRTLRTLYAFQIALGIVGLFFAVPMVAVMATDAPGSGTTQMIMGGAVALLAGGGVLIAPPWMATRELERYGGRRLGFNLLNTLLLSLLFLPLGLAAGWLLYRLRKEPPSDTSYSSGKEENTEPAGREEKRETNGMDGLKVLFFITLLIALWMGMQKYQRWGEEVERVVLRCGSKILATRRRDPTLLYYGSSFAVWGDPHTLHNLRRVGRLKGKEIVVTNPYFDPALLQPCLTGTPYRLRLPSSSAQ